jgi:hypothetical protein
MALKTIQLNNTELCNIASALVDNIFKCQDKIDGTKNKFTIEGNTLKIEELKAVLDKIEKAYYK